MASVFHIRETVTFYTDVVSNFSIKYTLKNFLKVHINAKNKKKCKSDGFTFPSIYENSPFTTFFQ